MKKSQVYPIAEAILRLTEDLMNELSDVSKLRVFYLAERIRLIEANADILISISSPDKDGMSDREKEVYELLVTGNNTHDIAAKLFLSEKTVKFHLTNIYKKMGVTGKFELISKYVKENADNKLPVGNKA